MLIMGEIVVFNDFSSSSTLSFSLIPDIIGKSFIYFNKGREDWKGNFVYRDFGIRFKELNR